MQQEDFPQEAKLILCEDPENPHVLYSAEVRSLSDTPSGTEENLRPSEDVDATSGPPPHTWSRGGGELPRPPRNECAWGGQVPHGSKPQPLCSHLWSSWEQIEIVRPSAAWARIILTDT